LPSRNQSWQWKIHENPPFLDVCPLKAPWQNCVFLSHGWVPEGTSQVSSHCIPSIYQLYVFISYIPI
jgi:hypothetical protein